MNRSAARRIKNTANRVEGQPYDFMPRRRTPRPGFSSGWAICTLPSPLNAATGTWPNITPTSVNSVALYRPNLVGTGIDLVQASATVQNYRGVNFSVGQLTLVLPITNEIWMVDDQDC